MIWATVSSWSCFCWLYRASPSLAAKNILSLILVLAIWWCLCVESSLVLLEKDVCYDLCVLLSFFMTSILADQTNRKWRNIYLQHVVHKLQYARSVCDILTTMIQTFQYKRTLSLQKLGKERMQMKIWWLEQPALWLTRPGMVKNSD